MNPDWNKRVREALLAFIASKPRSRHIEINPIRVYVRRSMRAHFGVCLDIATVDVLWGYRRKGYFKALLREAEQVAEAHFDALYVENVANPRLAEALARYGYESIGKPVPSFVRKSMARKDLQAKVEASLLP